MAAVSTELREAREGIAAKRKELATIFEQAGPDTDLAKVESLKALPDTTARVAHIKSINDALDELVVKAEPLEAAFAELTRAEREAAKAGEVEKHPGHVEPQRKQAEPEVKSFGELVMESDAIKHRDTEVELDYNVKTLFQTTAGWEPEAIRGPRVVDFIQQPLAIVDVVPTTTTGQNSVVFMEETTYTNNAAETAEGGTFPEAALALTERNSPVRKISEFLPVTDEQLEDVPQVSGYINNRLPFMLRQRLNGQILNGNGTAPNLRGIRNTVGIQTQTLGADDVQDAVYKAIVKVNVTGGAVANAIVFNQLDWQGIRLQRTTDGLYIWGNPTEAGPERMWGLPVVFDQALASGKQLVGDFANFAELSVRRGVTVKVSDSHADYFINGKQAIRADMRAALVVYRPSAFCEVTA